MQLVFVHISMTTSRQKYFELVFLCTQVASDNYFQVEDRHEVIRNGSN